MLNLIIFISSVLFYRDIRDGLEYEDATMKRLISCLSGTKSVFVRASVETIKGGREANDGFAYPFRDTLENLTFEENGNLSIIESRSFENTPRLKILNLSMCKKLKTVESMAFENSGIEVLIFPFDGIFESISGRSFYNTKIESVTFPRSMISAGSGVFKFAYNLKTVTFEKESMCTTIYSYAFEASGIERITIPKSVSSLSAMCFALCRSLSEIQVEYGSEYFVSENNILYNKDYSSLVCFPRAWNIDITVKDGVQKVLDEAFRSSSVKSIVFPSTLQSVGYSIVTQCTELVSIEFKDGVQSMSTYALQSCSIRSFIVPKNLTFLNEYLLNECKSLNEVRIHSNVTIIMNGCFKGCSSLESIEFPEGNLESISEYAFRDCIKLKSVILPQSIQSLGGGLFEYCHSNLSVQFRGGRLETDNTNKIIYAEEKSIVIQMFAEPLNLNILLPSTVINISKGAFAGRNIESIEFGSNVKHIEERAFAKCKKLKTFNFPSSIISLSTSIFAESNIQNISLNSIPYIPDETFKSCLMIETVIITPSIQYIGEQCFMGAKNLKRVEFKEGVLYNLLTESFSQCESLHSIKLPKSIESLSGRVFSGNSVQSVSFESGCKLNSIPEESFMDSKSLKTIIFNSEIISLDPYCLANCMGLETLTLTKSIKSLKRYCLSGCINLKKIIIENGSKLESIENNALEGLNNLEMIEMEEESEFFKTSSDFAILYLIDSISKEEKEIIKYCGKNGRKEFEIPGTVEIVSACSFERAIYLEKIKIGENVNAIGARAFADCTSLKIIEFSKSVKIIGSLVFEGCYNLTCGSIIYPKSMKELLKQSGLSEEVLNKCITREFSIISSFKPINCELISIILSDIDDKKGLKSSRSIDSIIELTY